jgi:formylglycine-generating enzyme
MSRTVIAKRFSELVFIGLVVSLSSCGSSDAKPDAGDSDTCPDAVDPQIEWVEIPVGSFTFGSPDGTPCMGSMTEKETPVMLTRPFLMAKYEITQRNWAAVGFPVPPNTPLCDNCPVMYLTWYEALAWCNALSRFEGREECYDLSSCQGEIGGGCPEGMGMCSVDENAYRCDGKTRMHDSMYDCNGYRLPTGPEWEYAAKAGTTTNTYNGDITMDSDGICVDEPILNDIAWYCHNTGYVSVDPWSPDSLNLLQEVGLKQPNPFGLYDMLGNASEWVDYVSTGFALDSNEGKPGEALIDPIGTTEDDDVRRDLRGGTYHSVGCRTRSADQVQEGGDIRGPGYGFRPVRTLPSTAPDAGADSGAK